MIRTDRITRGVTITCISSDSRGDEISVYTLRMWERRPVMGGIFTRKVVVESMTFVDACALSEAAEDFLMGRTLRTVADYVRDSEWAS